VLGVLGRPADRRIGRYVWGFDVEMGEEHGAYQCMRCGRKITEEEYETYSGLCEECHEIEIDELDYEDDS